MEEGGERSDEESDDAPIPPDSVIFPKKLSLSLIGIGPTQPCHPKRKKDSSKFVRSKDKGHKSDRLLDEFKKKIHNLRLKRSMKIWCTAKCTSDAYRCLHIYSDPGDETSVVDDAGDICNEIKKETSLWISLILSPSVHLTLRCSDNHL